MFSIFSPLFGNELWKYGLFGVKGQAWTVAETFIFIGYVLAIIALAYVCGSVNSAILVTRFIYKEDIRTKGSGNPGMTNVMRNYGWLPALITLLGDMIKCIAGMMLGTLLLGIVGAYIGGLCGVLGHIFPVFYKFKGGKGVASTFMFLLYVNTIAFLIVAVLFVLLVLVTRYLSLGSVICALALPIILVNLEKGTAFEGFFGIHRFLLSLAVGLIVLYRHRANISRIMDKTESKFSFKKTKRKSERELMIEAQAENEPEEIEEELTPEVLARKEANRKKSAKKKK